MDLPQFCSSLSCIKGLNATKKAIAMIWWLETCSARTHVSVRELALTMQECGLGNPNQTNLGHNLTDSRYVLKSAKGFRLKAGAQTQVEEWIGDLYTRAAESAADTETVTEVSDHGNGRCVFVVHGRELAVRDGLFQFLRTIGLEPIEWSQAIQATGKPAPFIAEILEAAFKKARAVVVLMTPDDEARLRPDLATPEDTSQELELSGQARPNVIFEAGMAMGCCPNRTVLVAVGSLRPFSDIGGIHILRLNNSTQARQQLAQRLKTAGCAVNTEGTDWHTAGTFVLSPASR